MRFVPVPYVALDACRSPMERELVLRLYELGHSRRWEPVSRTTGGLALPGVSAASVGRLLRRLESIGLLTLELEYVGKRRDGFRIAMKDPSHDQTNGRDRNDGGERPKSDDAEEGLKNSAQNTLKNNRTNLPRVNLNHEPEPRTVNTESVDFETARAYWREHVTRAYRKAARNPCEPNSDRGRTLKKKIRKHGLPMVLDAFRAMAYSNEFRFRGWRREGRLNLEYCLNHVENYADIWTTSGDAPTLDSSEGGFSLDRFASRDPDDDNADA